MTETTRQVWLSLRHRIGSEYAITVAQIGADLGADADDVRASIYALRHRGYQIIYSHRSPVGYHIPSSPQESRASTNRQRAALLALCEQIVVLEGCTLDSLIKDIRANISLPGAAAEMLHAQPPEPATKKQVRHLSHLALSAVATEDEADMIYRNIASPAFSKVRARVLISDLRGKIEAREQDRIDSKRRRTAYQSTHHPDQESDTLVRRDESRVRQVWKKAQEDPDGTNDDSVRDHKPPHPR